MDPTPNARTPEVGALTRDGSRMWNGQYWVLVRREPALVEATPVRDSRNSEFEFEQRGYHFGKVILAAAVGVTLTYLRVLLPVSDPSASTFLEVVLFNFLLAAATYASVVAILSLGRQGIDVLILRGMSAGFLMGVSLGALSPVYLISFRLWLLWIVVSAVFGVVGGVPALAAPAALLNLLWYQSFHSLRPQLPVFLPRRAQA